MLTLLSCGQGQNSSFDADYQAVLNRAVALGYTLPSASQRIIQNNLVLSLKSGGVWTKLDILYIFANDGGQDFGTLNWKAPTLNQSTLINTPTFTTNEGFMGNGTSSYIDTNFNPSTQGVNYSLNNASRYAYVFSSSTGQRFEGNALDSNNMRIGTYTTHKINSGSVNTLNSAFTYSTTKGMKSIHRTTLTDVLLYNASVGENRLLTSTNLPNANQFIFRAGSVYVNTKISMYGMGSNLITENTAFVNAFDTYLNSL
jgi:hypothetical protein